MNHTAHLLAQGVQLLQEKHLEGILPVYLDELEGHLLEGEVALGEGQSRIMVPGIM